MSARALTGASAEPIVLSLLDRGDAYGYRIIHEVRRLSGGEMAWAAGSLYPILHRMKAAGLVTSYWEAPEGERRRRYYRLTPKGRRKLEAEKRRWLAAHNVLAQLWGLPPAPLEPSA